MKKLKIGILGCANIAKRVFIPNIERLKQFEFVAIASRSIEKAEKIATQYKCEAIEGYEKLICSEKIDCVYIPLPIGLHHEWIIKCLKNGKHVFSEKSITEKYESTKEIIELANDNRLCVYENFMFVKHSQYNFVFNMIEAGEIGKIRHLKSSFGFPEVNKDVNIRYIKKLGGGALLDAGAYTVKAAQFFLGFDQELIGADLNYFGKEVDYQGSAMLKSSSGVISQLSFGFDNYYQNNIEIWGSEGKIIITRAFTAGEGYMPEVIVEKQNERTKYILAPDNQMEKILLDFYNSTLNCYNKEFDSILNQSMLLNEIINNEKVR